MQQLVQLQERYDEFKALDTEIISVVREEKSAFEGIAKIHQKQGVTFPILNDYQNKQSHAYSQGAFFTYIIDKQGMIRAILPGTTYDRPHGKMILAVTRQLKNFLMQVFMKTVVPGMSRSMSQCLAPRRTK